MKTKMIIGGLVLILLVSCNSSVREKKDPYQPKPYVSSHIPNGVKMLLFMK